MQLRLPLDAPRPDPARAPARRTLLLGGRATLVTYVRHRRARHYVIRVQDDGSVRVTVPRGGKREEADRFVREKAEWIERERSRAELRRAQARSEQESHSHVLVHGEEVPIEILEGVQPGERLVRFGAFHLRLADDGPGALPAIERHLRRLATEELPRRLTELAAAHGRAVAGVTIRAQRTRWGSCSPTGRISLNWRLIQLPPSVRDYVLLHELTHLIHLNHSRRFWRELERVCPWHGEARGWLRARSVSRGVR